MEGSNNAGIQTFKVEQHNVFKYAGFGIKHITTGAADALLKIGHRRNKALAMQARQIKVIECRDRPTGSV